MDAGRRRQRSDVENIADAVLRIFGGALRVGDSTNLPGQIGALEKTEIQDVGLIRGWINSEDFTLLFSDLFSHFGSSIHHSVKV